ncbi:MAG: DUF3179 domain-containing protein [Gemmatimonadetes bacterium]|nr:DUF3179 domain-containing protein [Gemmatimonadota bacterium]
MYARQVGGQTLTFGVSGMLYRDALVMYDRQTGTLWSQVDGRGIQGALAGARLEPLPSIHATWKEWRATYPTSRRNAWPGSERLGVRASANSGAHRLA